jgi:hypothetical protein
MTLLETVKQFFEEAYPHKTDYGQFHLVVDERKYKQLKKFIEQLVTEYKSPAPYSAPKVPESSKSAYDSFQEKKGKNDRR